MGVSVEQKNELGERYRRFVRRGFRKTSMQITIAALLAFLAAILLQKIFGA
jgi:hypothetical protein